MSSLDRVHRVALIGAGRIAAVHLRYARGVRNARVVAVCDADPARAEEFAAAHGIPSAFHDVGQMMRDAEPSIVHVVTPPRTHAPLALTALRAGANVLVEKPMAMTEDECRTMTEAARENGRRLCVDHNRLFDPVVMRARKLVESGAIGTVVSAEAHQGVNLVEGGAAPAGAGPASGAHWSVEDRFAPLFNLGPHPLYLVEAFIGAVSDLDVVGVPPPPGGGLNEEIRILLRGERALGFVAFSMGAQPYLNHLTVYGTKATLRANLNTMTLVVERVRKLPKLIQKTLTNLEPAAQMVVSTVTTTLAVASGRMKLYPGIGETVRRFYRSIDEGTPPPVGPAEGRENVRMLVEITRQLERADTARAALASRRAS